MRHFFEFVMKIIFDLNLIDLYPCSHFVLLHLLYWMKLFGMIFLSKCYFCYLLIKRPWKLINFFVYWLLVFISNIFPGFIHLDIHLSLWSIKFVYIPHWIKVCQVNFHFLVREFCFINPYFCSYWNSITRNTNDLEKSWYSYNIWANRNQTSYFDWNFDDYTLGNPYVKQEHKY